MSPSQPAEPSPGRDNGGDLVSVAAADNPVEAGMLQGLLEDAGIPSTLQHTGIDGPKLGFGLLNPSGGRRSVQVRPEHAEKARAVLEETLVEGELDESFYAPEESGGRKLRDYGVIGAYAGATTVSIALMGLAFLIFLLVRG